jgi:toxin ParE1/3/4
MAEIFANRAFAATDRLAMFSSSGRIVPEFERADVREVIFGNYRIMYQVLPDVVEVVAFVHGSRALDSEILER